MAKNIVAIILAIWLQSATAKKSALLVIDVQNCFLSGGTLAVDGGEDVIPIINGLRDTFDVIAFTRDWHPSHHISFASKHTG